MGEVYRARDTRLGREAALKILPSEVADDPIRRQRFELDARAVATLNHPNIVTDARRPMEMAAAGAQLAPIGAARVSKRFHDTFCHHFEAGIDGRITSASSMKIFAA
jgi:serine/threonine protein kinase